MNFTLSKRSWGFIIAMLIMGAAVMSGIATGVIPDVLRMIASVCAIVSIGVDWRRSSIG